MSRPIDDEVIWILISLSELIFNLDHLVLLLFTVGAPHREGFHQHHLALEVVDGETSRPVRASVEGAPNQPGASIMASGVSAIL